MAELKTKKRKASPRAFIAKIEDPVKRADARALLGIFDEALGIKPAMWGTAIIGYGSYHYVSTRSSQKGDWPLVAFSPRAKGITVYIMPGFKEYAALLAKIGPHKISGGSCLYIRRLADIHIPTLKTLIKQSVAEMKKRYGDSSKRGAK